MGDLAARNYWDNLDWIDEQVRLNMLAGATEVSARQTVEKLRRQISADHGDEQLKADIAAVLTVYDAHTPAELAGPWRDRLAEFASYTREGGR